MHPLVKQARIAGLTYLVCALTAPFSLLYVPGKLFVRGDAAATAANVLAHETMLRWSVLGGVVSTTAFAFAVLALYRLLQGVDRTQATLMVFLGLASVPLAFVVSAAQLGALNLLQGSGAMAAVEETSRQAFAMLLIGLRGPLTAVSELFWGLWLFPFGILVIRSRFLPRLLGVLLLLNGGMYVALSVAAIVFPAASRPLGTIAFPLELGELWIVLWLVIRGANVRAAAVPAPAVASA